MAQFLETSTWTAQIEQILDAWCHINRDIAISTAVLLKIIDNGSGIRKTVLDKIFDPYFSTKKMDEGTGRRI